MSNNRKGHEGFLVFLEGIEKKALLGSHLLWVSFLFLAPEVLCCPENKMATDRGDLQIYVS